MPRLFLFPFWILGSALAHPGFHTPAVARKFYAVFRASKKAQNHTPGNKAPPVWPCFLPAVKTAPVWRGSKVIRNRGHPAAQPYSTERRRGAAGSRRGSRRAAKEDTQRDPRSQYNGRMDKGQPAPSPSRVGIVLCSLLYTFSRTKAHPATTLGAPLCWREGLPPPRLRRRYYPARRMMRGEEGPKVFRLKTKKILAFRYANPIQTPHRR